jgi:arylformamidase
MRYGFLSHIITKDTLDYGGKSSVSILASRSIKNNDTANVYQLSLSNHTGTHVDAPNHFFSGGKRVGEYKARDWHFKHPFVCPVRLARSQILTVKDLPRRIPVRCDLILFKSGWSGKRLMKAYFCHNPGIHPEVAAYIRAHYPHVRAIGIDWLSVSSYDDRDLGREAHRAFLQSKGKGHSILIIEDMDLSMANTGLKDVYVCPLRVQDIDSSVCTVIGRFI